MLKVPHFIAASMTDTMPELIFNGGFITIETVNGTRAFIKHKSAPITTTLTIQQALDKGIIKELHAGDFPGWKFNYKENTDPSINVDNAQIGDIWLNNLTGKIFVCTDNTPGDNVWVCEGVPKNHNTQSADESNFGNDVHYRNSLTKFTDSASPMTFGIAIAPPDLAKKLKMVGKPKFTVATSADYGQYIGFNHLGKEIGEFVFIPTIFVNKQHYETNKGFKVEYGSVEITCDMNCDKTKFVPMDAFQHKNKTIRGFFISKYWASLDDDGYFVSRGYKEPCYVGEYFISEQKGIASAVGYANDSYKTAIKSIITPLKNQRMTIPHIQQYEVLHFIAFLATHGTNPVKIPTASISNILSENQNAVVLQNKTGVIGLHPTYSIKGVGFSSYHKDAKWSMSRVPNSKQNTELGQKMLKLPWTGALTAELAKYSAHNRRITGIYDMSGGMGEISWGLNNIITADVPANTKNTSNTWKKCKIPEHDYYDLEIGTYQECDAPSTSPAKANISTIVDVPSANNKVHSSSNAIREKQNNAIKEIETINGIKKSPIVNITEPIRSEDANQRIGANSYFDSTAITRVNETLGAVPIFHLGLDTEEMKEIKFKFENGETIYALPPCINERSVSFTSFAQVPNATSDNYLKQNTGTYCFRLMVLDD